jgi:hypothetical protein
MNQKPVTQQMFTFMKPTIILYLVIISVALQSVIVLAIITDTVFSSFAPGVALVIRIIYRILAPLAVIFLISILLPLLSIALVRHYTNNHVCMSVLFSIFMIFISLLNSTSVILNMFALIPTVLNQQTDPAKLLDMAIASPILLLISIIMSALVLTILTIRYYPRLYEYSTKQQALMLLLLVAVLEVFAAFKVIFFSLTPIEMLFGLFKSLLYYFAYLIAYNTVLVAIQVAILVIVWYDYKVSIQEEEEVFAPLKEQKEPEDTFRLSALPPLKQ